MGENLTRGALGVVLFVVVLALAALGLAATFAVIYMRLAATLPPNGATVLAAVMLCAGVILLALLGRWLWSGLEDEEPELVAPAPRRADMANSNGVRDGLRRAINRPPGRAAAAGPIGGGFDMDLHADPADHPRRHH